MTAAGRAGSDRLRLEPEAVEAMARAEILADLGITYLTGLRELLRSLSQLAAVDASPAELAATRERARTLIRDGRLLRHALDPDADRVFLEAVERAELVLEEMAAVEADDGVSDVRLVQSAVRETGLEDRIAAVNIENDLAGALAVAGNIAADTALAGEYF